MLSLEARGKFSRCDFLLSDPTWMKRKLCKSEAGLQHFDIRSIIKTRGGLIRIENFLPGLFISIYGGCVTMFILIYIDELAHRIEAAIKAATPDEWAVADNNYSTMNIDAKQAKHRFFSSKRFPYAQVIFRLFRSLCPNAEATLSAGSYRSSQDHIEPHDDRAFQCMFSVTLLFDKSFAAIFDQDYSREIAMVYYITPRDWNYEVDGGGFVDYGPPAIDGTMKTNNVRLFFVCTLYLTVLQNSRTYNPTFNSLVLFSVPRWHAVQPIKRPNRNRLSIFGWFLQPGQLYQL
jgi:hypothetical protein